VVGRPPAGTWASIWATPEAQLKFPKADAEMTADLTAAATGYEWGINGPYPNNKPFTIKQGQQATMTFTNSSRMWHPMPLHCHNTYHAEAGMATTVDSAAPADSVFAREGDFKIVGAYYDIRAATVRFL